MNSKFLGTSQECLQKVSERYIIQNWRYPNIGPISVRKWANEWTDRHTRYLELFESSEKISQEYIKKIRKISPSELEIYLVSIMKSANEQTDRHTRNLEIFI